MNYYHHVRREIEPLLPEKCGHILDVGAGAGGTLHWLKTLYPDAETTGVEINPAMEADLKRNADVAIIGSVDETFPRLKTYDLILFLDVLEHLADPHETLRRFAKMLNPGGHVIVSVPNIAHISVSLPLLLFRRFEYQDAGILDRTHLKFFVERTAIELLNDSGLIVTAGLVSGLQPCRWKWLDRISFGHLRHHLASQYIMCGEAADPNTRQTRVGWEIAP